MQHVTAFISDPCMDIFSALIHFGNFLAPAVAVPLLLWWPARWAFGKAGGKPKFWLHGLLQCALCLAVLAAALVLQGRDGKMSSYAALVLVCASYQWCLLRGWRTKG